MDLARVCAPDGVWLSQACGPDQECMGSGGCALATDISCNVTDSGCIDATHAVVCNADGKGFQDVTCPTGTVCSGFGTCIGTCVVGSSECNGANILETCTDGFTFKDTNCMPGMTTCVSTSNPVIDTAACMPASCTPQGTVCGNKAADPTSTDPNYASFCSESPTGLHWESEQCAVASSCFPGVGCTQTCTPGQLRCSSGGIQTCDATSNWGAITACQPTATGVEQVCQQPVGSPQVVCGDKVCSVATGACAADGFHACTNGKVAASGTACATGVCVGSQVTNYDGWVPGSCQPQCTPGASRCDGNEAYEACDANSRWSSNVTQCPVNGTDRCVQYVDASNGAQKTLCGACAPGVHRCTDTGGVVGGANPNTSVETCDSTGHWGSPATCSMGQCQAIAGPDAACVMQCVPNSTVCLGGAPGAPTDPQHPGTVNWGTCDANGNLPTTGGTACGAGTSCRKHSDGQAVGVGALACVQCVGSDNEAGLVDSACITTASPNSVERCTSGNVWNTPSVCANTTPYTGVCRPEGGNSPVCSSYYYCHEDNYPCEFFWGVSSGQYGDSPDCCQTPSCFTLGGAASPATCN